MTDLDRQLHAWADARTAGVTPVSAAEARATAVPPGAGDVLPTGPPTSGSRPGPARWAIAAAIIVVALIAAGTVTHDGPIRRLVGGPEETVPTVAPPVDPTREEVEDLAPQVACDEFSGGRDGPVVDTLTDFAQADLVALVTIDGVREEPVTPPLVDAEDTRILLDATIVRPVAGGAAGEEVEIFVAVRATNPQKPEQPPFTSGSALSNVAAGGRAVVALTIEKPSGERELTSNGAFFVDVDGRLSSNLEAQRERCARGELIPLYAETRGFTTDELLARLDEEAAGG